MWLATASRTHPPPYTGIRRAHTMPYQTLAARVTYDDYCTFPMTEALRGARRGGPHGRRRRPPHHQFAPPAPCASSERYFGDPTQHLVLDAPLDGHPRADDVVQARHRRRARAGRSCRTGRRGRANSAGRGAVAIATGVRRATKARAMRARASPTSGSSDPTPALLECYRLVTASTASTRPARALRRWSCPVSRSDHSDCRPVAEG